MPPETDALVMNPQADAAIARLATGNAGVIDQHVDFGAHEPGGELSDGAEIGDVERVLHNLAADTLDESRVRVAAAGDHVPARSSVLPDHLRAQPAAGTGDHHGRHGISCRERGRPRPH